MKSGELISVGGVYIDINAPQFPLNDGLMLDTEVVGEQYVIEPGGSAVNFAKVCANLQIPTTFIGKVGRDEMGQLLAKLLVKNNVVPTLVESEQAATNLSFNMVNPEGKSVMAVVGNANQQLTADEVYEKAAEKIAASPYFYIGGCFKLKALMPAFIKLADDAKQAGTKVVLDHGRLNSTVSDADKEVVRQLAVNSDFYLPSVDEFLQLWDVATVEEGIHDFTSQSDAMIVVKNGSRGALTTDGNSIVTIPAFDVDPIHTVGAGDSFNAGFIAAQYKGSDLVNSVRFACATAALKISQPTLPTYEDVVAFIDTSKVV